jgi:hypothetical protein
VGSPALAKIFVIILGGGKMLGWDMKRLTKG